MYYKMDDIRNLEFQSYLKNLTRRQKRNLVKKLKRSVKRKQPYFSRFTIKDAFQKVLQESKQSTRASTSSFSCGYLVTELVQASRFPIGSESFYELGNETDKTINVRVLNDKKDTDCIITSNNENCTTAKASDDSPPEATMKENEISALLDQIDIEVNEWHNPYINLDETVSSPSSLQYVASAKTIQVITKPICKSYSKFGTCKFGYFCSKQHEVIGESDCIVIPGMFSSFSMDIEYKAKFAGGSLGDVFDVSLEYSFCDLYDEYKIFFEDVVSELKKYGCLLLFKVCYNQAKHIRGNVYIQYSNCKEAESALINLKGRSFGGKSLYPQFILIRSWKQVICFHHFRYQTCDRGKLCNYLHVFHNPEGLFDLNRDFQIYESLIPKRHSQKTKAGPCRRSSSKKNVKSNDGEESAPMPIHKRNKIKKYKKKSRKCSDDESDARDHKHHKKKKNIETGKSCRKTIS